MLRVFLVLVVVAALFAGAYGAAAALGPITPNNIQAGTSAVAGCDTGGVSVRWKTMVSGLDFKVAGVEIRDLDSACLNQVALVSLQSAPGSQIGFLRGTVVSDGPGGAVAYCNEFFSGGGWQNGETGVGPKAQDVNYISIVIKSGYVDYDAP